MSSAPLPEAPPIPSTSPSSEGRRPVVRGTLLALALAGAVRVAVGDALDAAGHVPVTERTVTCDTVRPDDEGCAADVDVDGVPDHRDVCLDRTGREQDPAPVDGFGCARAAGADRDALVLDGLVFPVGGSALDGDARALLDRLARALLFGGSGRHEIAAHTDGVGSRAFNYRLSERRAEAVRRYLMLRGVDPNSLRTRGHGESRPVADDATAAGRRANRRVEIVRVEEN